MPLFLDIFANITIILRKRKILPPNFSFFRGRNTISHPTTIIHTLFAFFRHSFTKTEDMHFLHTLRLSYPIRPMHEVVPRVVAIAVRMVMAKLMIFCQSSFFMMVDVLMFDTFCHSERSEESRKHSAAGSVCSRDPSSLCSSG